MRNVTMSDYYLYGSEKTLKPSLQKTISACYDSNGELLYVLTSWYSFSIEHGYNYSSHYIYRYTDGRVTRCHMAMSNNTLLMHF